MCKSCGRGFLIVPSYSGHGNSGWGLKNSLPAAVYSGSEYIYGIKEVYQVVRIVLTNFILNRNQWHLSFYFRYSC